MRGTAEAHAARSAGWRGVGVMPRAARRGGRDGRASENERRCRGVAMSSGGDAHRRDAWRRRCPERRADAALQARCKPARAAVMPRAASRGGRDARGRQCPNAAMPKGAKPGGGNAPGDAWTRSRGGRGGRARENERGPPARTQGTLKCSCIRQASRAGAKSRSPCVGGSDPVGARLPTRRRTIWRPPQ